MSFSEIYSNDFKTNGWDHIAPCQKPTIAAISDYAISTGCYLALMCNIKITADATQLVNPRFRLGPYQVTVGYNV